MSTSVTIYLDHAQVRCPFHLKSVCSDLPSRRWSPERRCWIIPTSDVPIAVAAFKQAGEVVGVIDKRPTPAKVSSSGWAVAMFAALPDNLRAPAFRALAKVLHPDHGGDGLAMASLTSAFEEARR